MNVYRNRLLIFLLLFLLSFVIYFSTDRLNKQASIVETSDEIAADNQDFLKTFSGEWETSDGTNKLKFSEKNQHLTIEFLPDNYKVNVTVSSQQPSRKRWLLSPTDGEEIQYSVTLVSDDELSFQRSSTKPNTEGTSKPESFCRVK